MQKWLLIGICIVFLMMILAFLSRIKVRHRSLKYLGVLSLLLLFEYISLTTHPFIANITHHDPFLIFAATIIIASVLVPIHHRMEKFVEKKLSMRRRGKIRVKKTIVANGTENKKS